SWLFYVAGSPLALLRDGIDAVVVFFVLSGLVLAPPFLAARPRRYRPFVVRRICRIWIPYAVVLIVAVALYLCLDLTPAHAPDIPDSPLNWRPVPTLALFARSLFMIGLDDPLNPPMWTLVHEMRISLIFPLLVLLVTRLPWRTACLLAAGFSIGASVVSALQLGGVVTSLAESARWACFFVFGVAIARYRDGLRVWFSGLRQWQKLGLAVMGLFPMYPPTRHLLVSDDTWFGQLRWLSAAGAVLVFVVAINSRRIGRLLEWPPLTSLGRVSYGVYLLHAPVLIIATSVSVRPLPFTLAVALVPVVTVALAAVLHRFVELPAIGLGRRLSQDPHVAANIDDPFAPRVR
ncbi:MAG TPA: acyltransferase, partial [Stellaceae bacterium]|nr:acyltransferase [Stellaceae bacterium]